MYDIFLGYLIKKIELSDQLIIATSSNKKFALLVDSIHEVLQINENDIIKSEQIIFGIKYVKVLLSLMMECC